jgi:inorganic pyrophosphatase
MDLARIPVGVAPPADINVVVEVPRGGDPVKYEVDKASGAIFVDRFLHTAMFYPAITASCRIRCPRTAICSTC